jgi:hypothetical protein
VGERAKARASVRATTAEHSRSRETPGEAPPLPWRPWRLGG